MFSKSRTSNLPSVAINGAETPSIIAADLKIVGNLICGGSIEVEGEIEGNVTCGQVTIRKTGSIKGDVTAETIHVDGEVDGLVKGKGITISETGRVSGIIIYESLSIKDGAYIDGQCKSADRFHHASAEELDETLEEDIFDEVENIVSEVNSAKEESDMEIEDVFAEEKA